MKSIIFISCILCFVFLSISAQSDEKKTLGFITFVMWEDESGENEEGLLVETSSPFPGTEILFNTGLGSCGLLEVQFPLIKPLYIGGGYYYLWEGKKEYSLFGPVIGLRFGEFHVGYVPITTRDKEFNTSLLRLGIRGYRRLYAK